MENTLDNTTSETISLLEARLLRVEHLLYGGRTTAENWLPRDQSAAERTLDLEKRLNGLVSRIKAYGEVLRIYGAHPTLFQADAPPSNSPPAHLSAAAVQATVVASAPAISATASALTAVQDCSVPDPAQSAALVALRDRIRAAEVTQLAQDAEVAALRARSETAMRRWYEGSVLGCARAVAGVESRVSKVESTVRRRERAVEEDKKGFGGRVEPA